MRIIQPCGPSFRDDGGPFYIQKWINRISGVVCDRVPVSLSEREWGEYDAVIYVDWGQDCFANTPFPEINPNKPSLCWLSDTHVSAVTRQTRYEWAKRFRVTAWYMKDAADEQRSFWLPTAGDHEIYEPFPVLQRYTTVCFVGTMGFEGLRTKVIQRCLKEIPRSAFSQGTYFHAANAIYQHSQIVLNGSLCGDLNTRTFEALLSGRLLLTDRQQGMEELGLQDGVHCVMYRTVDEAIAKAHEWLGREEEREAMAARGRAWALANHTFAHRARTLLDLVGWKG